VSILVEASPPSAPETQRLYTYDELVAEMAETNQPHELWDGALIMSPTPSFLHQEIVFRFHRALYDWVVAHGLGKAIGAPIDMVLSPHRAVQPDVAFIAQDRLAIIQRVILAGCRNKHILKCTCCFCWPIRMLFPCERIM
jgi:Uma2 family endonuclease